MSGQGERRDQHELGPDGNYSSSGQAQYPPSQYPYPGASSYPALDQDMNIPDGYGQPLQSLANQLQAAADQAQPQNGDINAMNAMRVNTNNGLPPGMAPPQTGHQLGYSPAGSAGGGDDVPDSAGGGGDSKRKRSKISRACDECRRKKIKCDAVDEFGNVKPCTNCQKTHSNCEYVRIPQKRGPSKGYIKELSERVQQVEAHQAALKGEGFRHSMDAGSVTDGLYSQDDPMSAARRQYSFSDGRNPFANFQRDRFPSLGGDWANNSPVTSAARRDRNSLAIPPDQNSAFPNYNSTLSTFWEQSSDQPPAKRARLDSDTMESIKIKPEHLGNYYTTVHPNCPILPDVDTAIEIIKAAPSVLQHCLLAVVNLFPEVAHVENGASAQSKGSKSILPNPSQITTSAALSSNLESFAAATKPQTATIPSALVYAWTSLLQAIWSEYELEVLPSFGHGRARWVAEALDAVRCVIRTPNISSLTDSISSGVATEVAAQVEAIALFLGKMNSLSLKRAEFVLSESFSVPMATVVKLPTIPSFLAYTGNNLSPVICLLQGTPFTEIPEGNEIKQYFHRVQDSAAYLVPGYDENSFMAQQFPRFLSLILSRYTALALPMTVLSPAVSIANALEAKGASNVYDPLDMHCYLLVAYTLLEVLIEIPDIDSAAFAEKALKGLESVLADKIAAYHAGKSTLNKETWYVAGYEQRTWMEVLLERIQHERNNREWAVNKPGVAPGPQLITARFYKLVEYGYLNALARDA